MLQRKGYYQVVAQRELQLQILQLAAKANTEWMSEFFTDQQSWYPWSTGNRERPCRDAIEQSRRACNLGIDVYTIGYGVSHDECHPGAGTAVNESSGLWQDQTIEQMASDPDYYFEESNRGSLTEVFGNIGREITAGGTRLVE